MPAGYSGTPLAKKLGLKAGMRAAFVRAPDHLPSLLGELPEGLTLLARPAANMDYLHAFCPTRSSFLRGLSGWRRKLAQNGMLWISWPKKSSKLYVDLTEGIIREAASANDLVDVKVCAVDEDWSGLKLVIPKAKRRSN